VCWGFGVLSVEQRVNAVFREHFMCVVVFGILGSGFGQKWSKSLAKSHYFGCTRHCRTQKVTFGHFGQTQILGSQNTPNIHEMFPEYSINPVPHPQDLQDPNTHEMFPKYNINPLPHPQDLQNREAKSRFLTVLPKK